MVERWVLEHRVGTLDGDEADGRLRTRVSSS
jgi:hypothetical protein